MTQLRRQSLTAYAAPLCETIVDTPKPQGKEVLVRIERCGLCHSDLHIQDGYADLGGGKRLDTTRGMTLPFTLGHEIAGVVDDPCDLVTESEGQGHATRGVEAFAAAEIGVAVLDMQVGMAQAAALYADQHFLALGLRRFDDGLAERRIKLDQ